MIWIDSFIFDISHWYFPVILFGSTNPYIDNPFVLAESVLEWLYIFLVGLKVQNPLKNWGIDFNRMSINVGLIYI